MSSQFFPKPAVASAESIKDAIIVRATDAQRVISAFATGNALDENSREYLNGAKMLVSNLTDKLHLTHDQVPRL